MILVDPAGVVAQSPNGGHDLYVAITRATHRLTVVHEGDLPASRTTLTARQLTPLVLVAAHRAAVTEKIIGDFFPGGRNAPQ